MRTLKRHQVGALPLLHAIVQRAGLREVLERYGPPPTAKTTDLFQRKTPA